MENWFTEDCEAMTKFIHETSRNQINVPKVLKFSWLKSENVMQFYRSCVRNPTKLVVRFHAGNLTLIPRLLL